MKSINLMVIKFSRHVNNKCGRETLISTWTNNFPMMTSLVVTGHIASSGRGNPRREREWSYPS